MWYIYTMEYYSAIRNNEFMKFLDKMDGSEEHHTKYGNPVSQDQSWYELTDKQILA